MDAEKVGQLSLARTNQIRFNSHLKLGITPRQDRDTSKGRHPRWVPQGQLKLEREDGKRDLFKMIHVFKTIKILFTTIS